MIEPEAAMSEMDSSKASAAFPRPDAAGNRQRTMARRLWLHELSQAIAVSSPIGRASMRIWYHFLTHLDRNHEMTFMNYGYAHTDPAAPLSVLEPGDECNRYGIQLYQHLTAGIDLRGRNVLEVGCGRGGGASFVARYLKPASLTGVDIAAGSVEFCNRHFAAAGLTFTRGRAEALEFGCDTFDVVLNVESSHGYRSVPRFLAEARRVLKPDGWFLFADFRRREEMPTLRRQLAEAGFTVVRETDITANVVRALEVDNDRKIALIDRWVPRPIRRTFKEFAGAPGSACYESFTTARWAYSSFIMTRNGTASATGTQSET